MSTGETGGQPGEIAVLGSVPEAPAANAPAWEMIAAGRYMPRRIRGSFRGRELG